MGLRSAQGKIDDLRPVIGVDPVQGFPGKKRCIQSTTASEPEDFFQSLNSEPFLIFLAERLTVSVSILLVPEMIVQPYRHILVRPAILNPLFVSLCPGWNWGEEKKQDDGDRFLHSYSGIGRGVAGSGNCPRGNGFPKFGTSFIGISG